MLPGIRLCSKHRPCHVTHILLKASANAKRFSNVCDPVTRIVILNIVRVSLVECQNYAKLTRISALVISWSSLHPLSGYSKYEWWVKCSKPIFPIWVSVDVTSFCLIMGTSIIRKLEECPLEAAFLVWPGWGSHPQPQGSWGCATWNWEQLNVNLSCVLYINLIIAFLNLNGGLQTLKGHCITEPRHKLHLLVLLDQTVEQLVGRKPAKWMPY